MPGPSSVDRHDPAPVGERARAHAAAGVAAPVLEQRREDPLDHLAVHAGHEPGRRPASSSSATGPADSSQRRRRLWSAGASSLRPAPRPASARAAAISVSRISLIWLGAAGDRGVGVRARLRAALAALEQLDLGDDAGQRRPQLVRELGREPLLVAQARRDAVHQRVERARQLAELVGLRRRAEPPRGRRARSTRPPSASGRARARAPARSAATSGRAPPRAAAPRTPASRRAPGPSCGRRRPATRRRPPCRPGGRRALTAPRRAAARGPGGRGTRARGRRARRRRAARSRARPAARRAAPVVDPDLAIERRVVGRLAEREPAAVLDHTVVVAAAACARRRWLASWSRLRASSRLKATVSTAIATSATTNASAVSRPRSVWMRLIRAGSRRRGRSRSRAPRTTSRSLRRSRAMYWSSVLSCTIAPSGQAARTSSRRRTTLRASPASAASTPELGRRQRRPRRPSWRSCGAADRAAARRRPAPGSAPGAAQQRPQPRHQLVEVERLGQVVVAAGAEAREPVGDRVARR